MSSAWSGQTILKTILVPFLAPISRKLHFVLNLFTSTSMQICQAMTLLYFEAFDQPCICINFHLFRHWNTLSVTLINLCDTFKFFDTFSFLWKFLKFLTLFNIHDISQYLCRILISVTQLNIFDTNQYLWHISISVTLLNFCLSIQ